MTNHAIGIFVAVALAALWAIVQIWVLKRCPERKGIRPCCGGRLCKEESTTSDASS